MSDKRMKAIVATGYGSPDVLQFQEVKTPKPKPDEVLIKIINSSATTADTLMRQGKPSFARLFLGLRKPKNSIPGTGFSGTVEQVGLKVTKFCQGDRVFGETTLGFGANAEYLTISENAVILKMPVSLDFTEAACFCDGHLTSFNFLVGLAKLKPGQKVLINGASGALGTSAVQFANQKSCHVTAVCSAKNFTLVKSLGAEKLIDYNHEDFTNSNKTYDIIFDTVGKSSFRKCRKILSEKGVYISPVLRISLLLNMMRTTLSSKKAIFQATGTISNDKLRDLLSEILKVYNAGKLQTIIDKQFPLEELSEAHRFIEKGHKRGNVVIANT
jgi:NADPH:quinone reductase-like Zn-dependent oxidoreductase